MTSANCKNSDLSVSGGRIARLAPFLHLLRPVPTKQGPSRIYVLACAHESDYPIGGTKMLYRHVDVLNKNGFSASILHARPRFRYTWFENATSITYLAKNLLTTADILVIPEIFGPYIAEIGRGMKKVIFNQGCYNTFRGYSFEMNERQTPYLDDEVLATIVVSQDSLRYLEYAFPTSRVFRIRYSIDSRMFSPTWPRQRRICFMPRKKSGDLLQVANILKFRGLLDGFEMVPIDRISHSEVASALRDCLIYLSTSTEEGFGLPPAEAMACGCIVIGYDGRGGREYFDPGFSFRVEEGDIVGFAKTVEHVLNLHRERPEVLTQMGENASTAIHRRYSLEAEEGSIVDAWTAIRSLINMNSTE
jgi:hypothetical protein